MLKEIERVQRLISRKQDFLHRATNAQQRMADMVTAEIRILSDLLQAISQQAEFNALEKEREQKRYDKAREVIKSFECICLMHGITDYPMYVEKQLPVLLGTLKELYKKKEVIVPNQLRMQFDFN